MATPVSARLADSAILKIFQTIENTPSGTLSGEQLTDWLSPRKDRIEASLYNLLISTEKINLDAGQATIIFKDEGKASLNISGFPVELKTDIAVTCNVDAKNLHLTEIKGIAANAGLMSVKLIGVQFKPDGDHFEVDLHTSLRPFTVKIKNV